MHCFGYGNLGWLQVLDDRYVLLAISDTQSVVEPLDKRSYFTFKDSRPIFDRIE